MAFRALTVWLGAKPPTAQGLVKAPSNKQSGPLTSGLGALSKLPKGKGQASAGATVTAGSAGAPGGARLTAAASGGGGGASGGGGSAPEEEEPWAGAVAAGVAVQAGVWDAHRAMSWWSTQVSVCRFNVIPVVCREFSACEDVGCA